MDSLLLDAPASHAAPRPAGKLPLLYGEFHDKTGRTGGLRRKPRCVIRHEGRAHLAGPADTAALRGKKRHVKTDKTDARHLRVHLMAGDLPECRIPPEHVL
jgi:hypothetical protein